MKISLIHPSRGRPKKAYDTSRNWLSRAAEPENTEHLLSIDVSDKDKGAYLNHFNQTSSLVIISPNDSVVQATNAAAQKATGDILLYLSDDFQCPDKWDALIREKFNEVSEPLLIKVDDCLQPFDADILTIPIMNRLLYNRLGYFWNPAYKSMFVDTHLYYLCKQHHYIQFCPDLKFEHCHYSNGKAVRDETYRRSEANWNEGQRIFNQHKAQGFPL